MATNVAGTAAREYSTQQIHYLRKTVNFNDAGISAGVKMGTLPANAQIMSIGVNVKTAFNAATTNVLTVGSNAASYNNMVGAADVNEAAVAFTSLTATPGALDITADTDVYAMYTQTGTAATTGKATIVIAYAANNDG